MSTTLTTRRTAGASMKGWRAPGRTVPIVAGAFATLITAAGSGIPSPWGDEAASALSAQRSLPSFVEEVTHVDAVHAVYYAALHVWVDIFGTSIFSLRLPSALAIGLTVAGVIVLARLFIDAWRLPLIAGAIALLLPRLDHAGVEARGYAGTAALACWIMVAALATMQGRLSRRRGWTLISALLTAGMALNLYVGSLIAVIGCLTLLPEHRAHRRPLVYAAATALVVASPVIVLGVLERKQVAFLAQRHMPPETWLVSQWFGYPVFAILGWGFIGVAVVTMLARRDRALDRGLGLALVLWAGLPTIVLVGSMASLHNYSPRYLTFTAPGVALLIALGIETLFRSRRLAGVAALAVVVAASLPWYAYERTPNAENASDWAQVAALIEGRAHAGDQLAFDQVVRPSRRPESAYRLYPHAFKGLDLPQLQAPYWATKSWHDQLLTIEQAVRAHRFTSRRVFAVESDFPHAGIVDHAGLPALESVGYRVTAQWRLHSDAVFELTRS